VSASSLSSTPSAKVPRSKATKGRSAELRLWTARATSSLPVLVSPRERGVGASAYQAVFTAESRQQFEGGARHRASDRAVRGCSQLNRRT